jgi:UDP-N-acetylmuramoyl-tripeptide--D-alanyl-D-alanine ligase
MKLIKKIKFSLKRPRVIIVTGKGKETAAEAIFQSLRQYLKIKKISVLPWKICSDEILLFESDSKNEDFNYLIQRSSLPILIGTQVGDIPSDRNFFAGEEGEVGELKKLAKILPTFGYLILNFDDETVREIKTESRAHTLTFGFQEGADLRASDIRLNRGTNFKIRLNGSLVPVWLEGVFGKEQIYAALVAATAGKIFDLNLVKISQGLKNYHSLPGKMRLIKGIKNSWILDDSESATAFSMIEAIEILGAIEGFKRKIAVLGDVIGIGKYTIEAHETIGEKVFKNADLLFTIGPRAKFIGQGANIKGMLQEKIFQFEKIEEAGLNLQNEIKEGDLILVDGSKEMEMSKIVEEIKAF